MKIEQQDLTKLQRIESLFGKIDKIYSGLGDELKEELHKMHNEDASIDYCIRWGSQAASEIVEECSLDTKSLLEEFRDYCKEKADEAGEKYRKQHPDKHIVYDGMWDSDRDDCDMYSRAVDYILDDYADWFDDCESIDEFDDVLREEYKRDSYNEQWLDDEKGHLSYGSAVLNGTPIIEVGSIGRWNGTAHGLNILKPKNIGELLTSDCEQWMCYIDKESGEFCKIEAHHDGRNFYEYRELTCDLDDFKELLGNNSPGEMETLVSKYSKSIGPRVADVYGWEVDNVDEKKKRLDESIKEAAVSLDNKQVDNIKSKGIERE